jgi:hypothetical protein
VTTRDYRIKISRENGALRFVLEGEHLGPTGIRLQPRPPWPVESAVSDQLRTGSAPRNVLQTVQAEVSKWVLKPDLYALLTVEIARTRDPVRLIWQIDGDVRPDLSEVPFEAITPDGGPLPYVTLSEIVGFTHLLPKTGTPPLDTAASDWPLRCLMLRANPPDLGGAVPPAIDLVTSIRAEIPALAPGQFLIDVLTSETPPNPLPPGVRVLGSPTFNELTNALDRCKYDVFVFVGHGDVDSLYTDQPPVPFLQLEDPSNTSHIAVPAERLSYLLYRRPVPVVLLMGCLTAATLTPVARSAIDPLIPRWMRGSEGVAQALINGSSGVKISVGMRYRTEVQDVCLFLSKFFHSLLIGQKGNVEIAVLEARRGLYSQSPHPSSWVAPMMFSSLPPEPVFPFITTPAACPDFSTQDALREQVWKMRAQLLSMSNADPNLDAEFLAYLEAAESELINIVTRTGPLIMPTRQETTPGLTTSTVLELHGRPLDVDRIDLQVTLQNPDGQFGVATASPPAAAAFIFSETRGPDLAKLILRFERTVPGKMLPVGPLASLEIKAGRTGKSIYVIAVEILKTDPKTTVCPARNALLVRTP